MIEVFNKKFETYLDARAISARVEKIAGDLNADYTGKRPLFIAILNGSFMFAADLFKLLTIEAEICFIKLKSYEGMGSTGNVVTMIGLDQSVNGRHVVILEDIIDTGKTLHEFLPQVLEQQPASVKVAALLHKPEAMVYPLSIDYLGFVVPNKFLLGYGLDFNGLGRNLKEVYQLVEDHPGII